jgi:formylglycine-generating enzyme required for sulfatase activity
MKKKDYYTFILTTLILLLSCQSLTPSFTDDSAPTQTQETISQPTAALNPTEAANSSATIPEVEMILVLEGGFVMGRDDTNEEVGPSHTVYLDAYYIDKYEVTNSQYRACVDVGVCETPAEKRSHTRENYFDNPEFDSYPVIYINWDMAKAFCEWRGGYLPTEAQWEKAARGADGQTYPWGEEVSVDETFGNFKYEGYIEDPQGLTGDTVPVGSYEKGVSPFGVHDMIGNVYEWVSDWFSATYYQTSPESNPLGADNGECMYGSGACKVIRGGAWVSGAYSASGRIESRPASASDSVGFRCARTP